MENNYYLAADQRFYEPIDRRPKRAGDFLGRVEHKLDADWQVVCSGVWVNFHHRGSRLPLQGWKIHLSTVPQDAARLLEVVASFLIARKTSFKFLSDAGALRLTGSKSWTRGASGKFITIYPLDAEDFKLILAELDPLTREFRGPYILSDKRYQDSKVLYYRYGGIRPNSRLRADGRRTMVLVAPDGREVEDVRGPVYHKPDWVEEPFPSAEEEPRSEGLNGGRYIVEKALHFSNTGGVYLARDARTGKTVVLKEARAHVHGFSDSMDAAALLRHEHALLEKIAGHGVAPRPVELFQEWEHLFLVEEHLDGYMALRHLSARGSLFLETRPTREAVLRHLKRDLVIARRLARIIDALHAEGIVWGDISVNNIMVHPETLDVRIIDLESAQDRGGAAMERIFTPGFADGRRRSGTAATVEDDYYGVGAVLLFLVTHSNGLLALKPEASSQMLAEMTRDFGLPARLTEVIALLLGDDASSRPRPSAVLASVEEALADLGPIGFDEERRLSPEELEAAVSGAGRFIEASADLHRKDRLFPADPSVFLTNPLGLSHGAAGVLYALSAAGRPVEPALVEWLLAREGSETLPPGLYNGSAGLAWSLLQLGRRSEAEASLEKGVGHPLLASCANLHDGLAGWGLTNLRFWLSTRDETYLREAELVGRALVATAEERDGGLCWPKADGVVEYGLGFGSSGIGLFLLYLDRALGGGFQDAAVRAFEHDLAHGVPMDGGGLSWHRDSAPSAIVSPYWKQGSAGVGIAALRFLKATGDQRYRKLVDDLDVDCGRKYATFPGRDEGLAGIGEYLLDAYLFTGEEKFLARAHRLAAGLRVFAVEQPEGVAYPGNGLARFSCDLATGSAGIALFLDRLRSLRPADFLLDELLS